MQHDISWPIWFRENMFDLNGAPDDVVRYVEFLRTRLSFAFTNPLSNQCEPYFYDGEKCQRSPIITDLQQEDIDCIKSVITRTENPYILGKCYESLFLCGHDKANASAAAKRYIGIIKDLCARKKYKKAAQYYKRALFLYGSIADYDGINSLVELCGSICPKGRACILNAFFDFKKSAPSSRCEMERIVKLASTLQLDDSDESLNLAMNLADYHKSRKEYKLQDEWLNRYADVCESLCEKSTPSGYEYIEKAISAIEKAHDIPQDRLSDLHFKRDKEHENYYESLEFKTIQLDEKQQESVITHCKVIMDFINSEPDSVLRFSRFLGACPPIESSNIDKLAERSCDSPFSSFFTTIVFDEHKHIVEKIDPSNREQKIRYEKLETYRLFHHLQSIYAWGYFHGVNMDEKLTNLLKEIVERNELIPDCRRPIVSRKIIEGFKGNIGDALLHLIPQFELGLSNYLQYRMNIYPIIKKGGKHADATIGDMLRINRFKKPLEELIGADLIYELRLLLVDKNYSNIRNRDAHEGIEDERQANAYELIAFIRILEAYCMAYDKDLRS